MIFNITVRKQTLTAEKIILPAHSIETIKCVIDFDAEWADYAKTLVFVNESSDGTKKAVHKLYGTDGCTVPPECLNIGKLYVGVIGLKNEGEQRLTTFQLHGTLVGDCGPLTGSEQAEYTPALWEQVLTEIQAAEAALAAAEAATASARPLKVSFYKVDGVYCADATFEQITTAMTDNRFIYGMYDGVEYRFYGSISDARYVFSAHYNIPEKFEVIEYNFYVDDDGRVSRDETSVLIPALDESSTIGNEDEFAFYDNGENSGKRISWQNIKAVLKAYFDNIYNGETANVDVPDDIVIGADGKLHLVVDGTVTGTGLTLPESGVGFNEWYAEKNEDDEKWYLHLVDDEGNDVIDPCELPATGSGGSGGGATGSTIKIVNKLASRTFTVMGTAADCLVSYSWTSTDAEDGQPTGDGTAAWYVNGNRVAIQNVNQGENSFDVKPHLVTGAENTVKLTIEDSYGSSKSMTWKITVSAYNLRWLLGEMSVVGASPLTVRMIPSGGGLKTVHVSVDGTEIFNQQVSTSGSTVTCTVPTQAHGAHKVAAWMTANVDGEDISTEPLTHVGIWTASGNNNVIVAVHDSAVSAAQYETIGIKYMVYDPANETAQVNLAVDGSVVSSLTVDRAIQTWYYRPNTSGTKTLSVSSGNASATIALAVESIGFDIAPVTDGLALSFDPTGRNNSEANIKQLGYTDSSGVNHPFLFSDNFDWVNGGIQTDEDGTALVIKRGTTVTLDTSLFADNAKTRGKEIKLVFKSKNVRNYDATLMSCVSGGIGLVVQAQQASLSSDADGISVPYVEEKKIEMDINIESSEEDSIATIWLKGIPSKGYAYSDSEIWMQPIATNLVIGSADCDVWVYVLKMYRGSLTRSDILKNYIADCTNADEIMSRYSRNNIYNGDGSINLNSLAANNPELRVISISAERMTTSKSDSVWCNVRHVYQNGGNTHCFSAEHVKMKAQGTSSLDYILAALNLDLDFSTATSWRNDDNEAMTEYAMTPNSIPVSYFNLKANVASSENANNVCLADDYNTYQPAATKVRADNPKVRDTVEGHPCAVFFTNSGSEVTEVGARSVAPGETILYFAGDMNNSKKNLAVFGQDNSRYPQQCCIEISNNNNDPCLFKAQIDSTELFDGDGNFEFRFPSEPTAAMIESFKEMHSWVVSTNRAAATGAALSPFVVYEGVTYTNDTADYRAAKFKAEVGNYFNVNSLLFHYLFTLVHCMVDNRAKNTFVSYEPDTDNVYRWNFNKDYDNDTALGNDNIGGLTFSYGIEDVDNVGAQSAFNAADSVLWCNVRDCLSAELKAMFLDRESAGAWRSSRIINKFNTYQNARPEALDIEDMFGKYFAPFTNTGSKAYIPKMLGRKENQREQFVTYQEKYMSSKFGGTVSTDDKIVLRGSTPASYGEVVPSGDLVITPYADMYITVHYGNAGTSTVRAKRGVATHIDCPADSLNDTEINIYTSSMISDIESLAALYTKTFEAVNARKLLSVALGSSVAGYSNPSMGIDGGTVSLQNNPLVELVDLRGTPNLNKVIDLGTLTQLKEFYASNSGITGVKFANGAPLEIAIIPDIQSLTARSLKQLTQFSMSCSALSTLWVDDCSDALDTLTIVQAAAGLTRGRLIGVSWNAATADAVLALTRLSGLDSQGNPTANFVLTGSLHLSVATTEEISAITSAFPDLTVTYGTLVPNYTVTFVNYDGTVLNTQNVRSGSAAVNPTSLGITPERASTTSTSYNFSGWNKTFSNVTEDITVTAVFTETARQYTVNFWKDSTRSVLLDSQTVPAGSSVTFQGTRPLSDDGIFSGWSAVPDNVVSDMDIYAVFSTATQPMVFAEEGTYDYLYSDFTSDNSAYSFGELMWILQEAPDPWNYIRMGDKIRMRCETDNFTDTSLIFEAVCKNHFKRSDNNGFAKVTWLCRSLLNSTYYVNATNTNIGGWGLPSAMWNYLHNKIYAGLPYHWRQLIVQTKVRYCSVVDSSRATAYLDIDSYMFTPSIYELGLNSFADEIDGDVAAANKVFSCFTDNASRQLKMVGSSSAAMWWTRTPYTSTTTTFCCITTAGASNYYTASSSYGVVCGFST